MGPSGAGKSTLLKILAGHCAGGAVGGALTVNGAPLDPLDFRRRSSVVWQSDVLLPCATVRESLMTSALLKLPGAMPRAAKAARVDQILAELRLTGVADARVGQDIDGAASGISGGERRRVSVGIGLVTDAAVLFLDEPTTGLDSESAATLVHLLSHLAGAKRRTVVCTIHQPSSDICEMFDDLLLLAGGRLAYCGRWRGVDAFLSAARFP
jgi:ABC-type multidrug transport system ATPase subunit